jgi:uncharacterized protein (TIGR00251 family)
VSEFAVSERDGRVRFSVHVQPRASRTGIVGIHGAALKVRLHSPPVDGAANDELIAFLAKSLGVAKRAVRVVAGHSSRSKTVEIEGVPPESVQALTHGAGIR